MQRLLFFLLAIGVSSFMFGQKNSCDAFALTPDSVQLSKTKEYAEVSTLTTKNNYKIQFIKLNKKNYLKLTVKANLENNRFGSLFIYSNKKQFFLKETTFYSEDKTNAYFLIDVNANYVATIRDNSITSLVFRDKDVFEFLKADLDLIKKQADCFYTLISKK